MGMLSMIPVAGPVLDALKKAWDFLWDAVAKFFAWLKRPGNKLRFTCIVLAVVAGYNGFKAYDLGHEIVVVRSECDAAAKACTARHTQLEDAIAGRDSALEKVRTSLAAQAAANEAARAKNAQLAKDLMVKQAEVDALAKDFAERSRNKPPDCVAALQVLEAKCPTMQDY